MDVRHLRGNSTRHILLMSVWTSSNTRPIPESTRNGGVACRDLDLWPKLAIHFSRPMNLRSWRVISWCIWMETFMQRRLEQRQSTTRDKEIQMCVTCSAGDKKLPSLWMKKKNISCKFIYKHAFRKYHGRKDAILFRLHFNITITHGPDQNPLRTRWPSRSTQWPPCRPVPWSLRNNLNGHQRASLWRKILIRRLWWRPYKRYNYRKCYHYD